MRFYIALFSFIVGLLPSVAQAEQAVANDQPGFFALAFQRAMSQSHAGNSFAGGYSCSTSGGATMCTSPYGGSVTQNFSQWSNNSGSTSWSYNNFTISAAGITMVVNGSFNYTGSVLSNGYLNGTMTGNLAYDITTPAMSYGGYNIPATTQHLTIGITANFYSNGGLSISMNVDGQQLTVNNWTQGQLLGFLY